MAAPRRTRTSAPIGLTDPALAGLGLTVGDRVRFRRRDSERWKEATVARREADGSLSVRDSRGGLRAIPVEQVEVRVVGPRGGITWEPLAERAARTEQMRLI
ncbi:MAG: hypothetical protein KGR18_01055 [Acidobacteria bacterium]|nr:hypothetical protein [Acidobacteriota bacterium]